MADSTDSQPLPAQPAPVVPQPPAASWLNGNVEKAVSWAFQVLVGIVAFLAIYQFNTIQGELKELRVQVEALRREQAKAQGADLRSDINELKQQNETLRKDLRDVERYLWRARSPSAVPRAPWSAQPKTEKKMPR